MVCGDAQGTAVCGASQHHVRKDHPSPQYSSARVTSRRYLAPAGVLFRVFYYIVLFFADVCLTLLTMPPPRRHLQPVESEHMYLQINADRKHAFINRDLPFFQPKESFWMVS